MPVRHVWLALVAMLIALAASPTGAETNLVLVLDGSGSMWGQVDGTPKIQTAKETLTRLLSDLPVEARIGLVSYGNNRKDDCEDVSILAQPGASSTAEIQQQIAELSPRGMTPIASALEKAGTVFASAGPGNNHVVLISDGLETCDGDPCASAAALAAKGIELKVHVVGFDVSEEEGAQLRCISERGGGQYFNASNTAGFEDAMAEVQQIAAAPAPVEPEPREFFRDDFDGTDLSSQWTLLNPDPNALLVEEGTLLLVAGATGSLADETVTNLSLLELDLPKGDWTMTASLTIAFQTGAETFSMGVHADKDNLLEARLQGVHGFGSRLQVLGIKRSAGADRTFESEIYNDMQAFPTFAEGMAPLVQPIELRLEKTGRDYAAAARFPGAEDPSWKQLEKFTVLRLQGKPFIGFYQRQDVTGESMVRVDWVKIEAPGAGG